MTEDRTILLHLTDLHFGDNLTTNLSLKKFSYLDIADLIASKIVEIAPSKVIIAIGGDVTNKGAFLTYQYANDFFKYLESKILHIEINYILCPGNHDVDKTKGDNCFQDFNKFASNLTKTEDFIYSKKNTCVIFETSNWSLVIANSMFEMERSYGLIDISSLENKLKAARHPIILLTHHHFIPIFPNEQSTIRNSYNVIKLCLQYNVILFLHGHVHSSFFMNVGNNEKLINVIGCGATLPKLENNYNNQFNIFELLNDGRFTHFAYRVINDSTKSHKPEAILNIL